MLTENADESTAVPQPRNALVCGQNLRTGQRWGWWDEGGMGRLARGNRDNWNWDKELRHVDQGAVRSLRSTNCECQAIITR